MKLRILLLTFLSLLEILVLATLGVAPSSASVYTTITYGGVAIRNNATGGDCTQVGNWNPASKTCTLTTDIAVGVSSGNGMVVYDSGITLDGGGHIITGTNTLVGVGVDLNNITGANVVNLSINQFGYGIADEAGSRSNGIIGNNISACANGIFLQGQKSATYDNNLTTTVGYGIRVESGGKNNILLENNLSANQFDIYIGGLGSNIIADNNITVPQSDYQPKGLGLVSTSNNVIYHNNFIANYAFGGGLVSIDQFSSGNQFNLPPPNGGNFWSDWTGPDSNNDGIVDTPRVTGAAQDNLPWVKPWGWDKNPPTVTNIKPSGWIKPGNTAVEADLGDGVDASGVNSASLSVYLTGPSGSVPLGACTTTGDKIDTHVSCPATGLVDGAYNLTIGVTDYAGNVSNVGGSFNVAVPKNYFWTWYDNVGGDNWVLMANPASASTSLAFGLTVGGTPTDVSGFNHGDVGAGQTIVPRYNGLVGGPVQAASLSGGSGILSQRSLWPKGGSSLEEVLGTEESKLSDHFYWSWYDEQSPGMTNWVLVANPSDTAAVHALISFVNMGDGSVMTAESDIAPGKSWAPTFPGKIGGPVEMKAYKPGGSWPADKMNVIASQRVLSNFGAAFNEVPGTSAGELSGDYLWTWYDSASPGAADWVMVSNPSATDDVYFQIRIANQAAADGMLKPGASAAPTFPGEIGGPVEVKSCSAALDTYGNCSGTTPDVTASQRTLWGPSFEEVPGYPATKLASDYHWTWYDQQSPGSLNWVMIANQDASTDVYYQVKIAGVVQPTSLANPGIIAHHSKVTPSFPGVMNGPVEVKAWSGDPDPAKGTPATVIASQRVAWKGYFNEVLGTVLN